MCRTFAWQPSVRGTRSSPRPRRVRPRRVCLGQHPAGGGVSQAPRCALASCAHREQPRLVLARGCVLAVRGFQPRVVLQARWWTFSIAARRVTSCATLHCPSWRFPLAKCGRPRPETCVLEPRPCSLGVVRCVSLTFVAASRVFLSSRFFTRALLTARYSTYSIVLRC